jgi:hypothetical protein
LSILHEQLSSAACADSLRQKPPGASERQKARRLKTAQAVFPENANQLKQASIQQRKISDINALINCTYRKLLTMSIILLYNCEELSWGDSF